METRFARALQGRGPRLPRVGRAVLCGSVIAVGIAQIFYPPAVRTDLAQTAVVVERARDRIAVINEAPIRVKLQGEDGPEAEGRFLWAVRYLMAIAQGGGQ